MSGRVSVVVPALNEAARIGNVIDRAFAAGAAEVIVADGGSSDGTTAIAREHGARVIEGAQIRSEQLNEGARVSTGEIILFLHADTELPSSACEAVEDAVNKGAEFGAFRLGFLEASWRLRLVAAVANLRVAITREPWGDQGQFVTRERFERAGGFRSMPLMEDYEFARRMKRLGEVRILPLAVRTSGRRILAKGVVRTTLINWMIIGAWHLGISPHRLARWYRGRRR